MEENSINKFCILAAILSSQAPSFSAVVANLGAADPFVVLNVTNRGFRTIHGDLGVWPGSAMTGFPSGLVAASETGLSDAVAHQD